MSAHALNFKRLFLLSAAVVLLGGCATTVRIHDTVRWRGKDVSEFIVERAGRMPDIVRYNCVKNKEVRNLYAWRVALYDVRQAYVGQQGNVQYSPSSTPPLAMPIKNTAAKNTANRNGLIKNKMDSYDNVSR